MSAIDIYLVGLVNHRIEIESILSFYINLPLSHKGNKNSAHQVIGFRDKKNLKYVQVLIYRLGFDLYMKIRESLEKLAISLY